MTPRRSLSRPAEVQHSFKDTNDDFLTDAHDKIRGHMGECAGPRGAASIP
jgi:hypothetical protein